MKKLVLSSVIALAISMPSFADDHMDAQVELQKQIQAAQSSFSDSLKASMEKMQSTQNPADYQTIMAEQRQAHEAHVAKMHELMQANAPKAPKMPAAPAPMMMADMPAPLTAEQLDGHRKAVMDAQNTHMETMKTFMGKVQAAKTQEERATLNKEYDGMVKAHMDKMKSINEATFGKAPAMPAAANQAPAKVEAPKAAPAAEAVKPAAK